jgi:hypothetical protein
VSKGQSKDTLYEVRHTKLSAGNCWFLWDNIMLGRGETVPSLESGMD